MRAAASRRRLRLALAGATVAALLTGCGQPVRLTDRPEAPRAVRDALAALVDVGRATYTVSISAAGHQITETGALTFDPNTFSLSRSDTGGGRTTGYLAVGDEAVYTRIDDAVDPTVGPTIDERQTGSGCWVTGRPAALAQKTPLAFDVRYPLIPAVAVVASTAKGGDYVDDASTDVNGSLGLREVLGLIGPDLPQPLRSGAGRVTAQLHIVDGVLLGYSVQPYDFAGAAGIPQADFAVLGHAEVEVSFTVPDAAPQIVAPSAPGDTVRRVTATSPPAAPGAATLTGSPTGSSTGSPSTGTSTGGGTAAPAACAASR